MSIINAQNLSKSYGVQDVLTDISVAVPAGARIALVGKNGIGKTTLLRLITGVEDPDQGLVHRAKNLRIGYLPQEASYSKSKKQDLQLTLWRSSLEAFADLVELEAELENLAGMMANSTQAEDILKKYGQMQEVFEQGGGYTYPHRIRQVLNGFGFSPLEYGKSLIDFSGGERTRAFFARLLLDNPELLVLDEPTNHLDIRAVEWLEGWLRDWIGAAIIVSHDRYFLDRTVNTVWELTVDDIAIYRGNYSAYIGQREHRWKLRKSQYKSQQEFIQKEEEYIRRNIAGQNTRQAQGRRKRLQRMLRDQQIERPTEDKQVHIDFGKTKRSGNIILETEAFGIRHPEYQDTLFKVPDLVLTRGERVVLMGPNGSGKTTFLKTLLGDIESYEGAFKLGASLKIGYFAQAHEELNPERTVIEEAMFVSDLKKGEARNFLAKFLFVGDDVFKTVDTLSGGERGRLALVKLILQGANLLLLDEPTNHLDIPSQEVLESALTQFPETIVMVSHDRYLIDRLATQLWVIEPEKKLLSIFKGGYSEYSDAQMHKLRGEKVRKKKGKKHHTKQRSKAEEISLDTIEEKVSLLEGQLRGISSQLMDARDDHEQVRNLSERYAALEQDLQRHLELWERFASTKTDA
jgi:ATP-binding cassette subfamily F protein 3